MRCLVLLLISAIGLHAQSVVHYFSTGNVFPVWVKYSVVKTSGNWLINGGNSQAAAGATSQAITLFTLPANGYVHATRMKTTTACAGITAITLTSLGNSGSATAYIAALTYDLKAAVSATNINIPLLTGVGSNTTSTTSVTATISGTAQNISSITDGCALDVHVLWSVLP